MTALAPDLEQARSFLDLLDPDAETGFTFQIFDDSELKRRDLTRVYHGTIDEEQFEWVLERALASGERRVGLSEIQDLVLEAALGGVDGPGGDRGEFPGVH